MIVSTVTPRTWLARRRASSRGLGMQAVARTQLRAVEGVGNGHSPRSIGFRQPGSLVFGHQSVNHLVQFSADDTLQFVKGQVDAMVGHPPLRKIVGAYPLGSVPRSHL